MANIFGDSQSSNSIHNGNHRPLNRIAMRKIGAAGVHERFSLISADEILYFFTVGALASAQNIIDATWRKLKSWELQYFRPGRVYARTAKGIFVTRFRTIAQLLERLDVEKFLSIQNSLVVNVLKITDLDISGKLKQVSVLEGDATEWLTVSRRSFKSLKLALAI